MKKYLFFVVLLALFLIVSLLQFIPKEKEVVVTLSTTAWTNQAVEIYVKKEQDALYSFSDEDYSEQNTYKVTKNIPQLKVKMKLGSKEYEKIISITNIDEEAPQVKEVTLQDKILKVDASDTLSGIKEYVYCLDGECTTSTKNEYLLPKQTKNIEIKVIDRAGNVTTIPKEYFARNEITYQVSTSKWTNQPVQLTILKKKDYLEYSFSYDKKKKQYQKENSTLITKNGTLYITIKTKEQELKKTIEIKNIDKTKPEVTYTIKNGLVKVSATDNSKEPLQYCWNNEAYGNKTEKRYTKSAENQTISVKDPAGNVTTITFHVTIPSTPKEEEVFPTFEIHRSETNKTKNPVTITVQTEDENLVSFQDSAFTKEKTITIHKNVKNYKIRVKNQQGNVSEKTVDITNIITELTPKEKNQELIHQIDNTYHFKVSYGEGTYCYYAGKSCTPLYNEDKAAKALQKLQALLKKFPKDFFKKFQGNNGYRIILFDDIPGNTQGVTSYEFGDDNQMFVDVNNELLFERVIYHETWHFMEQLMTIKYGRNPFTTWDTLNPKGFAYGTDTSNEYTPYDPNRNNLGYDKTTLAFVSVYGKTSAREDRAEIFADLMFRGYKQTYMYQGYGINEKAKVMVTEIRKIWTNSEGSTWENYISW